MKKCNHDKRNALCRDPSVSGCARGTRDMRAQHFLGFPHYRPLDGKRSLSTASTAIENQTFSAGVIKN